MDEIYTTFLNLLGDYPSRAMQEQLMEKFILLWQIDWTKVPSTLRRSTGGVLIARVKYDVEKLINKEWDSFMGETVGYVVAEGNSASIGQIVEKYLPLLNFEIHPIVSECMN